MQLLIVVVFSVLCNLPSVEQSSRGRRGVTGAMGKCPEKCDCTSSNIMLTIYCGSEADFGRLLHLPAFFPPRVQFLSLSRNILETISENVFSNLTHLENLNLARNRLRDIPEGAFRDLRMLSSLNLGHNLLSTLPARIFQGLSSMDELLLSHNMLEDIPEMLFADLTSLKRLFLNGNRLKAISERAFGHTAALRGLFLDNNVLTQIAVNTFENLTSLNTLSISNNKISRIGSGLFRRLFISPHGKCNLRLDRNLITSLPSDTFDSFSASTMVALTGNSFHCNCRMRWLKHWIKSRKFIYSRYDIKCTSPASLRDKSLLTVSDQQFTCTNGQWSAWNDWTHCSRTCGYGTQTSKRSCTNPPPEEGGEFCKGKYTRWKMCQGPRCTIRGHWTSWSRWTACSVSCSVGVQRRFRQCYNLTYQFGATQCRGPSSQSQNCSLAHCPVDGAWSDWSDWSGCSVTCQGGIRMRTRKCSNPQPQHNGRPCAGSSSMNEFCYLGPCPINGGWSTWTSWSFCSESCSSGTMLRSRTCDNPSPSHGGNECSGSAIEAHQCNLGPCPVNGGWSSWNTWTSCTRTCANGTKSRYRTCDSPTPEFMGLSCSGKSLEVRNCSLRHCPINGGWSTWTDWSECSNTCSNGRRVRSRTCSEPSPQYEGHSCEGNSTEEEACNRGPCPIHGSWGAWASWNDCSQTCGNGTRERRRKCHKPKPSYGGQYCTGHSTEVEPCHLAVCPAHGGWTSWANWTECSKTCAGGVQTRTRTCESPLQNGKSCQGVEKEERVCNMEVCPQWNTWSNWTACSVTCGTGIQSRRRGCGQTGGVLDSKSCKGEHSQVRVCYKNECAGPDGWTDWSDWTPCFKVSLCEGVQTRRRTCVHPMRPKGQLGCEGKQFEYRKCKALNSCKPVRPSWSPWSSWSDCHRPNVSNCGIGTQTRWRMCRRGSGLPYHGNCSGNQGSPVQLQRTSCETPCNDSGTWMAWTPWGSCSQSCNGGVRSRKRTCISMAIGVMCTGHEHQEEACGTEPCPTHPAVIILEESATCPDPGIPFHSERKLIDQTESYYVMYTCKKHFIMKGPRLRHCENDGKWSDTLPMCLPICGQSSIIPELKHKRLRIFGGSPSVPGVWPWQVMLEFNQFHCGGTLIGERWIITAAHCVVYKNSNVTYPGITVYLGMNDITRKQRDHHVQTIEGERIFHHPKFNWKTYDSDIALIKLKRKVNITDYVRPACLPNHRQRAMVKPGSKGVILGWGMTESNGYTSKLREVHMPVVKHSTCVKAYKDDKWPVTSNMVCAGDKTNTDSCFKDSGGPFLFFDKRPRKQKWFLGGIISWGNPRCGVPGKYSVFTRLNKAFVNWIQHIITWEDEK